MMQSKARPCFASASDTALSEAGAGLPPSGRAEGTPQKRQQGSRTPNLAVYALQVSFDGEVGAERVRANLLQRRKFQIWRHGEGDARFSGNLRRIEEKKLVDDSGS